MLCFFFCLTSCWCNNFLLATLSTNEPVLTIYTTLPTKFDLNTRLLGCRQHESYQARPSHDRSGSWRVISHVSLSNTAGTRQSRASQCSWALLNLVLGDAYAVQMPSCARALEFSIGIALPRLPQEKSQGGVLSPCRADTLDACALPSASAQVDAVLRPKKKCTAKRGASDCPRAARA